MINHPLLLLFEFWLLPQPSPLVGRTSAPVFAQSPAKTLPQTTFTTIDPRNSVDSLLAQLVLLQRASKIKTKRRRI